MIQVAMQAVDPVKSRQMARVRSSHTAPEIAVRKALHARGFRFRLHRRDLPGRPDVVLPRFRLAILVHGCFWHGCPRCDRGRRQAKTNAIFWTEKIAGNQARDTKNAAALEALGWRVAVVWECDTRDPARPGAAGGGSGRVPARRASLRVKLSGMR